MLKTTRRMGKVINHFLSRLPARFLKYSGIDSGLVAILFPLTLLVPALASSSGIICEKDYSAGMDIHQSYLLTGGSEVCARGSHAPQLFPVDITLPVIDLMENKRLWWLGLLLNSINSGTFWSGLARLAGWQIHGNKANPLNDEFAINNLSDVHTFHSGNLEVLGNQLIPESIDPSLQHRWRSEIEQLDIREQRAFVTDNKPETFKQTKIHLAMITSHLRVICILPSHSNTHVYDCFNTVIDSLLQIFIPLLKAGEIHKQPECADSLSELIVAAAGGSEGGDGDGDGDDGYSHVKFFYVDSEALPGIYPLPLQYPIEQMLRKKLRLLKTIWGRLQQAMAQGNRNLALILRDRLMVISADMEDVLPLLMAAIVPGERLPEMNDMISTSIEAQQIRGWIDLLDLSAPLLPLQDENLVRRVPINKNGKQEAPKGDIQTAQQDKPVGSESPSPDTGGRGKDKNDREDDDKDRAPEQGAIDGASDATVCIKCNKPLTEQNTVISWQEKSGSELCDDCFSSEALATVLPETEAPTEEEQVWMELIDQFLMIPANNHLPLGKEGKKKLFKSIKTGREGNKQEKAKSMLDHAVLSWQVSQDSLKARESFMEARAFMRTNNLDFSGYIKTWLLLWEYKGVMEGSRKPHETDLLSALVDTEITPEKIDLLGLRVLFNCGALPGFEQFKNYELVFNLLYVVNEYSKISTPVSFTVFDHFRFCYFDDAFISTVGQVGQDLSTIPKLMFFAVFQIMILSDPKDHGLFVQNAEELGVSEVDFDGLSLLNRFFFELSAVRAGGSRAEQKLKEFRERNEKVISGCPELGCEYKKKQPEISVFFNFIYAFALSVKPRLSRLERSLVARYYKDVAQYEPYHWHAAFKWYIKAGMMSLAADAAKSLASFINKHNPLAAHYWEDRAERIKSELNPIYKASRAAEASAQSSDVDIDGLSAFIEGVQIDEKPSGQPVFSPSKKKKKKKSRRKLVVSSAQPMLPVSEASTRLSTKLSTTQSSPLEAVAGDFRSTDEIRKKEAGAVKLPVIPVYSGAINRVDISQYEDSGWWVKSTMGGLAPFQRISSENWNPAVKRALSRIMLHRSSLDYDEEIKVYQNFFNDDSKKIMVGIERIWEEYAWTKLRGFDQAFLYGALVNKKNARQVANEAKHYLLSSIGFVLGMDQLNAEVQPEAVWSAVNDLLTKPEYANSEVEGYLRFRLRCLFSSMGHVYSLLAMSSGYPHSKHLGDIAKQWYSYKRIQQR